MGKTIKPMRTLFLFIFLFSAGINSFGQKMIGYGGELSALSLKPNIRIWLDKATGFEVFGGISSELTEFKPNDFEAGFKILSTFLYDRTNRTYFGAVGKWAWVQIDSEPKTNTNLPVVGLIIGKEWSSKKLHRKGFAIEFGYQYGVRKFYIPEVRYHRTYQVFPLVLSIRYSLYKE